MVRKISFLQTFPAAAALAGLAALAAGPAGAAEVSCRQSTDYVVEVDGKYPPDARFYESDTNGTYLVDIPSMSKSMLIDVPAGRAVPVPRSSLKPDAIDGTLRLREPFGSDTPTVRVAIEGAVVAFQVDTSKVRILKTNMRPPVSGSTGTAERAADGGSARSCLRIESRPPYGIPGCTKWVYLRNTCTSRVVADIQRTEHLFSGTLPQAFSVVVAPGSEQSLGCAWWNGAMAPTDYELIRAATLDSRPAPGGGDHRGPARH